jgi:hypothetical protein
MIFARWTFLLGGIWGILVLSPLFFLENWIGAEDPPPITHPEYFYGFLAIGLVWQVVFLVIGYDPPRHRPVMIPSFLEKAGFAAACAALFAAGRVPAPVLAAGLLDLAWGVLFLIAYWRCPAAR